MKCPKCQFENPEEMTFCGQCGAKLERVCPSCNFSNPPQFKFCGKCGSDLTIPSVPDLKELFFDEKLTKIQKYLPKGLTKKILSQRNRIEGERKQVTVSLIGDGPSQPFKINAKLFQETVEIHPILRFSASKITI